MTNDSMENIFVFGASGHAKVIMDIIEREGRYRVACLVDDDPALAGKSVFGYEINGGKDALLSARAAHGICRGIVAIGSNRARATVAGWLTDNGFGLISAIHPGALLSRGVRIGNGTVIMGGAVINADAAIGDNVIINTGATVDHDCTVGNCAHIAPGVTLCGTVSIGPGSFVCSGATIIPNITVGCNVTVGAGATVVRNVDDGLLVVGTPAREAKVRPL